MEKLTWQDHLKFFTAIVVVAAMTATAITMVIMHGMPKTVTDCVQAPPTILLPAPTEYKTESPSVLFSEAPPTDAAMGVVDGTSMTPIYDYRQHYDRLMANIEDMRKYAEVLETMENSNNYRALRSQFAVRTNSCRGMVAAYNSQVQKWINGANKAPGFVPSFVDPADCDV